jgi:4'-phosphopantetheinyl transferase EntD
MKLPPRVRIRRIDARAGAWRVAPQTWLTSAERDELAHWRDPARRDEWLAGRWLLKEMIRRELRARSRIRQGSGAWSIDVRLLATSAATDSEIEVLSRDPLGRGRPPCVLAAGRALPLHVTLAHTGHVVWAALSTRFDCRIGIDVVPCGAFHDRATGLWFTEAEQIWLQQARDPFLPARLWAVKEAVYKATNRGESFVPARVEIGRNDSGRLSWLRDGVSSGSDDTLLVRRSAASIIALAIVSTACEKTGVRHD